MAHRFSHLVSRFVKCIGIAVLALLAMEVAARLFLEVPGYHRNRALRFDPSLGFAGRAGFERAADDLFGTPAMRLNADGFRGRPLPSEPADASTLRVAFFGDSFLVGDGVEESALLTAGVERRLREAGEDAEVFNLSVQDYGTAQELLLFEAHADAIEPDVIVLALYPANDLVNNSIELAQLTRVSPGDAIRPYLQKRDGSWVTTWVDPPRSFLRRHSRLFAHAERAGGWRSEAPPGARRSARVRLSRGEAPREDFEIFRAPPGRGSRWARAWETTRSLLRSFRDAARERAARFLVIVIPHAEQVATTARSVALDAMAQRHAGRSLDSLLDWNRPENELADFFEVEAIEAIFLLPEFRDHAARGTRVYARDGHLTKAGHAAVAAAVARRLGTPNPQFQKADAIRDAVSGAPIPLSPGVSSDGLLDFSARKWPAHVGDGFLRWSGGVGSAAGWQLGLRGLMALPIRDGDFVLKGFLPEAAGPPVALNLEVVGMPPTRFVIERPGNFEVRIARREGEPIASRDGHATLFVGPHGAPLAASPWIRAAGFAGGPGRAPDDF